MLTLYTGLPGSGKTCFLVEKVLMNLEKWGFYEEAVDSDGNRVKVKRRVLTNINGLLIDHEKIDGDDLMNWPEWAKPGDLIIFDEVQKPWPLTGANKEQPKCITELETHRHYGIDMIFLTQHPMLVNTALPRLCSQHLHIRKLGNSRFATVYEWDGVSRTLLYKNSFAKKPWRRSKAAEKLYRSSALHTKQKRSVPTVLFLLVAVVLGSLWLGPTVYARLHERLNPQQIALGDKGTGLSVPHRPFSGVDVAASSLDRVKEPVGVASVASTGVPAAVFAGCARIRARCACFDTLGVMVDKEPAFCEDSTRVAAVVSNPLDVLVVPDQALHERALAVASVDYSVLEWMARKRDAPSRVPVRGLIAAAKQTP